MKVGRRTGWSLVTLGAFLMLGLAVHDVREFAFQSDGIEFYRKQPWLLAVVFVVGILGAIAIHFIQVLASQLRRKWSAQSAQRLSQTGSALGGNVKPGRSRVPDFGERSPLLAAVRRHPFWASGILFLMGVLTQLGLSYACPVSEDSESKQCQKCGASIEITRRPKGTLHWFWISRTLGSFRGDRNCVHDWRDDYQTGFGFERDAMRTDQGPVGCYRAVLATSVIFLSSAGLLLVYGVVKVAQER